MSEIETFKSAYNSQMNTINAALAKIDEDKRNSASSRSANAAELSVERLTELVAKISMLLSGLNSDMQSRRESVDTPHG